MVEDLRDLSASAVRRPEQSKAVADHPERAPPFKLLGCSRGHVDPQRLGTLDGLAQQA
jgi:hypothetical protein